MKKMVKFTEKYDWKFKGCLANLPISSRSYFKKWFNELGRIVDEEK